MTREQAKALLPVIQAWSEGKDIQVRIKQERDWRTYAGEYPNFQNENWEWRVKPEPREFLIQKPTLAFTTSDVFLQTVGLSSGGAPPLRSSPEYEIIRVREVLEP